MKILAFETSCDETAIALIEASGELRNPRFKILANEIASQIKIHAHYGGVVPNLAKREHIKNLPILFNNLQLTTNDLQRINLIAVTVGPGLEPALWTGIEFAKKLAKKLKKPLIGANHLEGHLYSFLLPKEIILSNAEFLISKRLPKSQNINYRQLFPAIALIVSGGHTIILLLKSLSKWKKLGETRDDATGEAFDKVARMLSLPYPGGPELERIARGGDPNSITFPRPMIHQKNYDFSFSGLKTSVFYYLRNNSSLISSHSKHNEESRRDPSGFAPRMTTKNTPPNNKFVADIAASFQKAVIDVLTTKTLRAAELFKAKTILLSGGVAANQTLRQTLRQAAQKIDAEFFAPSAEFNTDNAAMIAVAAYMQHLRGKKRKLIAQPHLSI